MKVLIRTSMILAMLCSLSILHAQTWCAVNWEIGSSLSLYSPDGVQNLSGGSSYRANIPGVIPAGQDGSIQFQIDAWGSSNALGMPVIQFVYQADANYSFSISSTRIFFSGNGYASMNLSPALIPGDILTIEKVGNTIGIRKNSNSTYLMTITLTATGVNMQASMHINLRTGGGLKIKNGKRTFGCISTLSSYAQLANKLDGGYFTMPASSTQLLFQFQQEYEPQSPKQTYTIYNDNANKVPVLSGTFNVQYGNNWVSADVAALAIGIYTLELTANKGKKYYLRFKKQ